LVAAPERQRWLLAGVTFCGMVPQRAIPFQVIAVLGLNDGEFPRAPGDGGLDLMARYPRLGDRDVRNDDRYLFLETVMSARTALHLSYLGEGVRDAKPRNPSTPLAELLSLLDERACLRDEGDARPDRPWIVRHPLQPFDVRYFDHSDARLFSFRADLARLAGDEPRHARSFIADAATASAPVSTEAVCISLAEVLAYYRDPARQILRDRLHLRLDALDDDSLRTSEPLEAKFAGIERVARRLFLDTASDPATQRCVPETPPDWLRLDGLWPPGRAGEKAWKNESEKVQKLLDIAGQQILFTDGLPVTTPLAVDRAIGSYRVQGELTRVYCTSEARWLFDVFPDMKSEDELTFKQRIGAFLEWALLRLDDEAGVLPVRMLLLTADTKSPWQEAINRHDEAFIAARRDGDAAAAAKFLADLQRRVEALIAFCTAAQAQPSWYFPQTSWEVSGAKTVADPEKIWAGALHSTGERDYAPGYAAVLGRDARFDVGHADFEILLRDAHVLFALINFDPAGATADV
jgi:exodeoxyribonuclease V gamma subunit